MLLARRLDSAVLEHVDEGWQIAAAGFHWDEVEVAHDLVGGLNGYDAPTIPGVEILVQVVEQCSSFGRDRADGEDGDLVAF